MGQHINGTVLKGMELKRYHLWWISISTTSRCLLLNIIFFNLEPLVINPNKKPNPKSSEDRMENRSADRESEEQIMNHRLYNPYQDLNLPTHRLYQLPTSPEFLFQEECKTQRRSWGENLTYYTGLSYLGGSIVGAGKGLVDGVKASEAGDTTKLRVNRILNASGQNGRSFGNRTGVIGLMYAGLESGIVAVRDTDDVINSLVAGLGTGALYKAAAGVRSAAVGGAIGGVVVAALVGGKQVIKRYVPI